MTSRFKNIFILTLFYGICLHSYAANDIVGRWRLIMSLNGTPYAHEINITKSNGNIKGKGGYPYGGNPSFAWEIQSGTFSKNSLDFTARYYLGDPGTILHVHLKLASPNRMVGSWDDNSKGYRGGIAELTGNFNFSDEAAKDTQDNRSQAEPANQPINENSSQNESAPQNETKSIAPQNDNNANFRFLQNKDGSIVYDSKSRLMWQRCAYGQTFDGNSCAGEPSRSYYPKYVNNRLAKYSDPKLSGFSELYVNTSYAGFSDWRLPGFSELSTLIWCSSGLTKPGQPASLFHCDGKFFNPAINKLAFKIPTDHTYYTNTDILWGMCDCLHRQVLINFTNGSAGMYDLSWSSQYRAGDAPYLLLVRDTLLDQNPTKDFHPLTTDAEMQVAADNEMRATEQKEAERAAERKAVEENNKLQAQKEAEIFRKKFLGLGKCSIGESITPREMINYSESSGNPLADLIWHSHTQAQYIVEYEAIVEGFIGSKVKVIINSYKIRQVSQGNYVDGNFANSSISNSADKMVGKIQFYDKSRCY